MVPSIFDRLRRRLALEHASAASVAGAADPGASVAAILREGAGEPEVLLIRRAQRSGDPWSGHMAFPGGRAAPGDRDALHTALRETMEEVGLDLEAHAELLGRLDDRPAIARGRHAGLTIAPFVFRLRTLPDLSQSDEVEAVVWAPLGPLRRGEVATTLRYPFEGATLDLPGFLVGEDIVWGLTHRMLLDLFAVLEEAERG